MSIYMLMYATAKMIVEQGRHAFFPDHSPDLPLGGSSILQWMTWRRNSGLLAAFTRNRASSYWALIREAVGTTRTGFWQMPE